MNEIQIFKDAYPEQVIAIALDELKRAERRQATRDAAARRRRRRRAELRARLSDRLSRW